VLREIPGLFATYHEYDRGIEKDIIIRQFENKTLSKPVALEVNGVYHYARNSELPLGKDILK
jgi:hypothetical protein